MITEISLQNFKIFKDKTTFPLRQLNLLTGVNGGGKSTLLQSLLLMRQSIEHDERTTNIIFNGSCVELGTFLDLKNLETSRKEAVVFEFKVEIEACSWGKCIQYEFIEDVLNDIGKISKVKVSGEKEIIRSKTLIDCFNYIDAEKEDYIFLHQLSPIDEMIYYGQPHDFPYNFFSIDTYFHRIYFHEGKENIAEGRILVGHIGVHL